MKDVENMKLSPTNKLLNQSIRIKSRSLQKNTGNTLNAQMASAEKSGTAYQQSPRVGSVIEKQKKMMNQTFLGSLGETSFSYAISNS